MSDDHAGLGGWIGAIGAIVAIFAAWGLARSEYRRTRRESIEQKLRQLVMLRGAMQGAREIVAVYGITAIESRQKVNLCISGAIGTHQ
jgi:hypothetical protein